LEEPVRKSDGLRKMIEKGMDVARINMNYFDVNELNGIVDNIREASMLENKDVAIMVDLKGPLIRTMAFKE